MGVVHDPWKPGHPGFELLDEFGGRDSYSWYGIHCWAYCCDLELTGEALVELARRHGARGTIWCFKEQWRLDYREERREFRGSGVVFLDWSYPAVPGHHLEDADWNNTRMEAP